MYKFLRYSLAVSLSSLLALVSSCAKKQEITPTANPASAVVAVPGRVSAITQAWFASLPSSAGSQATGSRTTGSAPSAINWEQATYSENYVVAPFVDTDNPFAGARKYGYRFLVVRFAADSSCTGRLVEVLVDGQPVAWEQAASLALAGAKPSLTGQAPGSIASFTGCLLVYSPRYVYQTGLAYSAGDLQPLTMQIVKAVVQICYEYYLDGHDNTGALVVHDDLYIDDCGGIPSTGSGGGNTGGWGGGGGGSTGGTGGPAQMATINSTLLQQCQQTVLQNLQATSGAHALGIVALFSGDDPYYNWIMKDGHNNPGTMGNTPSAGYNPKNHTVTTIFDGSQMVASTELYIACAILHESIHAFLIADYFSSISSTVSGTFSGQYPDIAFLYASNATAGLAIAHHNEMANGGPSNGWIGDIAWSLREFGVHQNYTLPDQFYMDLAWAGLLNTNAFNALPYADQARIKDVVNREAAGINFNGTPALSGQVKGQYPTPGCR